LGDSFSWVGLALLAYEINNKDYSVILSTALTLRVAAFIIFSPFAGVLADNIGRKTILFFTHIFRMAIICCFPFIHSEWQIYVLVFLLNIFNAFFAPTYRAVIPQITEIKYFRQAVGLSTATFQLLGILGPAMAGIVAVWLGSRQIFFIDSVSFIIAAILIYFISDSKLQKRISIENNNTQNTFKEVIYGIRLLFANKVLRFALSIEFVSAIAGALILVNSVGLIKNELQLDDKHYGWIMSVFAIGAAISAFIMGNLDKSKNRSFSLIFGAILLGVSICFANYLPYSTLIILWIFAGIGQSLAEMPSETLIGEIIKPESQGKVYGSHFAFSHLWWAIAYPIAGYLGKGFPKSDYLIGGIISLSLCLIFILVRKFTIDKQTR